MAHLVFASEQVVIYDDVIEEALFRRLFRHANAVQYEGVHHRELQKVWRLHDGIPLRGPSTYYAPMADRSSAGRGIYPCGTPIDEFIETIKRLVLDNVNLVGSEGRDWKSFSVTPWIYPPGTGLSLHADTGYSGAFTFFLHSEWHLNWGGMLVVLDPATCPTLKNRNKMTRDLYPPWLSDEEENPHIWNPGLGLCVLPKPNRMVFMSPEAQHVITRVDASAGQFARVSLSGFFLRHLEF